MKNLRSSKGQFVKGHQFHLRHGHTVRHKMSKTYAKWRDKTDSYPRYGGRGIEVCERWQKFENFLADMGECPSGYTLEWATVKDNIRNRSITCMVEFRGEQRVLAELVELYGKRAYKETWTAIFKRGWSVEDALFRDKRGH